MQWYCRPNDVPEGGPNQSVKLTTPAPRFFEIRKLLQPALQLTLSVRSMGLQGMSSLIHYGFAQPFVAMLFVPVAAVLLAPSGWIAAGIVAGFVALLFGGDALARRRALGQVRSWALARGITDVRPCSRGGFVSWGWSVWAFAETGPYRGVAPDSSPAELLASYYAPAFGLLVFTQCESRAEHIYGPSCQERVV